MYRAFLKKLCSHYGIELRPENLKQQLPMAFKFPHQAMAVATCVPRLGAVRVSHQHHVAVPADLQAELGEWLKTQQQQDK
jgi:hypothetical protein